MKTVVAVTVLAAASITAPATAFADCGDPGQDPCTGPVPTVDQVVAIMDELTDPNIPAVNKSDIVTPAFTDDDLAQHFDHMLNDLRSEGISPVNFSVTDIEPAPNNMAGATVSNPRVWHERGGTAPIVLAYQGGHWMITRRAAYSRVWELVRDESFGHAI
jgi:hypothetical protein